MRRLHQALKSPNLTLDLIFTSQPFPILTGIIGSLLTSFPGFDVPSRSCQICSRETQRGPHLQYLFTAPWRSPKNQHPEQRECNPLTLKHMARYFFHFPGFTFKNPAASTTIIHFYAIATPLQTLPQTFYLIKCYYKTLVVRYIYISTPTFKVTSEIEKKG